MKFERRGWERHKSIINQTQIDINKITFVRNQNFIPIPDPTDTLPHRPKPIPYSQF